MSEISIFGGTGFVGSEFCSTTKKPYKLVARESRVPLSSDVLYFISTTDNYNVFSDLHKDIDVNLSILVDVLKNLKPGETTFNFISSWFVYGEGKLPATEDSQCNPKGFYSITKRTAEQLVISYCQTFKINYRILRLCNVYGTNDKSVSKQKNALQYLIERIKNSDEINLYHNGQFYRDYMHVHDVARAIDLCIEKAPINEIINIGPKEKTLFKNVIDLAVKITNSKSKITSIDPTEFHKIIQVRNFYMDSSKLRNLGFAQSIPLEEGIKELCQ